MPARFPSKLKVLFKPSRYKVLYGGRGGAKSWGVARALLIKGAKEPIRVLCAREVQTSIGDSVLQLLEDQINQLGLASFYQVYKTSIIGRNGTTFGFEGLRHNVNSLKSYEGADICWVEEAVTVSKNSWDVLIPTIRKDGSEIWITFNPELEEDETYQRFVINPPKDAMLINMSYMDNPWFPEVLAQEMQEMKIRRPLDYENVWLGIPRQAVEGAIYAKELDTAHKEGRIMKVPYDQGHLVNTYWDLGHSDQTAIWFIQQLGFEYRIIDYYSNSHEKLHHYLKLIQEKPYNYGVHYLPHDAKAETLAADKTVEQQVRDILKNVSVVPQGRIQDGIEQVRLKFAVSYFDKDKCEDGLTALRRYAYKKDLETGRISVNPEHNIWSHGCSVAGTMVETIEGLKPIERIEPGDKVWTPCGYSEVLRAGMTKVTNELLEINGNITATLEHKFFTDRGVVRADALRYNDTIWTKKDHLLLSLKESNIGYRDAIMSLHQAQERNIQTCTEQYGLITMVRYLKNIISIIRMGIRSTMTFLTWSVYPSTNIYQTTLGIASGTGAERTLKSCSLKQSQPLRNGTGVKRAGSGTSSMESKHGLKGNGLKRFVCIVKRFIQHLGLIKRNTVQLIVKVDTEGLPVYDLTIEHNHCYLANGMLVSNSDAFRTFAMAPEEYPEVYQEPVVDVEQELDPYEV